MKKLIVMLVLCTLLLAGCDELLQKADEVIGQADYYATDPNSPVQITAEQLEGLVAAATAAVVAIPGFPYAQVILGALAVANAAIALILKLRKRTTDKTLAAVVLAVDNSENKASKLIKEDVAANLQAQKIYRQGRAIIQDAKNS